MTILDTPAQLLTALGQSPFSTDPLSDLARNGYTLSPQLQSQWDSALKDKKLALPPAGVTAADFKGTLTFQQTEQISARTSPYPGNYDVLAGVSYAVADAALDALYQSGKIPHEIALDQSLSAGTLTALGGFFKGATGGEPSRFHITSAPTVAAATDGTAEIAVLIPFQLDWMEFHKLASGATFAKLITSAVGTLQLTMGLVAHVVPRPDLAYSTMTIGIQLDTDVSTVANSPRLTLAPTSPVQLADPAPPNQVDGTAVVLQNGLSEYVFPSGITISVTPVFNLSIGSLALAHADVVSKAGMLLAGLQIIGTGTTDPTDPTQLVSLLPSDGSNIYLQIQDSAFNAVIQSALQSGALAALAVQEYSNAVIDSASAQAQDNELVVTAHGRLVNECPLNVDLYFIDTRRVSLQLDGNSIVIQQKDEHSIDDADNVWCVLTTVGLIALAAIGVHVFGGAAYSVGGLFGFLVSNVGPFVANQGLDELFGSGSTSGTPIDLTQPIPDTDFLPTLGGGSFQIANGGLLIGAVAGTQADNLNTVIYVRFLVPAGGAVATATKPLPGVKIQLMAQDVPPSVSTAVPPATSSGTGQHQVSVTYTFVPLAADQQLAVGQTDWNGVVRFGLLASERDTTGGTIKEEKYAYDVDAQRFTTTTTLKPVRNNEPDLYFLVTMPDGSVVDTRQFSGGLLNKFAPMRAGTLEQPLTVTLGTTVSGHPKATAT